MSSIETLLSALPAVISILVVATLLFSVAVVNRLHRPVRSWGDIARARLVMGVPWGSLIVVALVLCVYLFVQDGISDFSDPVTIPYRAYSYFYPLGMLTASFSHAGQSHLVGNLAGAAVVAPIAEYAWGHYPDRRNDNPSSRWSSCRTDPWIRALIVFPLIVVAITIVTSLFALGPVIGFSGVVFAFAAFALVHYPIVTIVGVLGVQGALLTTYRALRVPIGQYVAQPSPPSAPSWAGIAIQGHALGFFIGLVLGVALLRRRNERADPLHIWLAILLFGFAQGLWQIYWFGGENVYYLFQGPGVFVVIALALVVTVAITGDDSSIVPPRLERLLARASPRSSQPPSGTATDRPLELAGGRKDGDAKTTVDRFARISEIAGGARSGGSSRLSALSQRRTASMIVLVVFAVVAGMAIPVNIFVLDDAAPSSAEAVEIEDYTVQYAEDVENELTSPVQIGPLADAVSLESNGVIVASEHRQLWSEVVPAQQLAFSGEESISVGGPGWREAVHVERTGWEPVGNDTVYQVEIWADGEEPQLAHESDHSQADVRIDDQRVTVASFDGEFALVVESIETDDLERAAMPEENDSTTAGGLTFEYDDETVYAVTDGSEVAVATAETYN